MSPRLRLVSHVLCPYVQRAVIVANEHAIPFERVDIDLANKPAWFLAVSPTGKVPLLEVTDDNGHVAIVFESAVIAEYLDELSSAPLLPRDPLERARHRAWVAFASGTLDVIGALYLARDIDAFGQAQATLAARLQQLEIAGPQLAGLRFGLADAAFAPVFRYLEVFRAKGGPNFFDGFPACEAWARRLARNPSVRSAVSADYPELLVRFVIGKGSFLGRLLADARSDA